MHLPSDSTHQGSFYPREVIALHQIRQGT